jgi:phosphatidylglycerol---prolipoprotein diacylglyceryl transferase
MTPYFISLFAPQWLEPHLLGFEFTSPGPIIFQLFGLKVHWYGVLIATAVLIGVFLAEKLADRRGLHPDIMAELPIWLIPSAIVAARAYYVTFQWSQYVQNPELIIAIWKGGIAIHGAILGGILAAIVFAKRKQVSFWQLGDCVAPSLILGQAIGRWGNFFNSEAFGAPTDLPWKLLIPMAQRPDGMESVAYYHPTFLYESMWNFLVFLGLMWLWNGDYKGQLKLKTGTIFLVYFCAYSSGRIWIESLRTDSLMSGGLRMAQLVSIVGITIGLSGLWWLYGKQRNLPDVVGRSPKPLD